jgi:hypothetical protein
LNNCPFCCAGLVSVHNRSQFGTQSSSKPDPGGAMPSLDREPQHRASKAAAEFYANSPYGFRQESYG